MDIELVIEEITKFDQECNESRYTDTGEAWQLFFWIRHRLQSWALEWEEALALIDELAEEARFSTSEIYSRLEWADEFLTGHDPHGNLRTRFHERMEKTDV
jgi:hypothetical protein